MKLSMKWLNDYVDITVSPKEYADRMTMTGSKVEWYECRGDTMQGVVVGLIRSVTKHPDADKLCVCSVDAGGAEPLQIVTGAKNVSAGDYVPVAVNGAVLPDGTKIRTGKLRGVESQGMLCSVAELGLTKDDFPEADEDGIFILQDSCEPGQIIQTAVGLDDTVFEFEITPNRPDCLSVIGLARETAASFAKEFHLQKPRVKGGAGSSEGEIKIKVEAPDLVSRFAARMVRNVKIQPSPKWMRERLRACGIRPINNIVDITNYVMLEYGQPMHAYDYRCIEGGVIVARRAEPGETVITLDEVERRLTEEMLVIADAVKPIGIAGIMGGEGSGITESTQTVVLESACFDGGNVRMTSKKTGLRSDASSRFEKGLDAEGCMDALNRACELIELLQAGEVCENIIDIREGSAKRESVPFDASWINRFLGTEIPESGMRSILKSLCFEVRGKSVAVPSFRGDVQNKADLAEEIARIWGYDRIPVTLMKSETTVGGYSEVEKKEQMIANLLISCGFSEIYTYSFIGAKDLDRLGITECDAVVIANPFGDDTSLMRPTTLASMLDTLSANNGNRNENVRLYEIAKKYRPSAMSKTLAEESTVLTLGMYGAADFFSLKGVIVLLLKRLGIEEWELCKEKENPSYHPGRTACLRIKGKTIGIFGQIHPTIAENYGIAQPVFTAELDMDVILKYADAQVKYQPLPRFPAVSRDLAFVCDRDLPVLEIERVIRHCAKNLLEDLSLFDVYTGSQISADKKSVAYSMLLRAQDRTLTDAETDQVMQKIVKQAAQKGIEIRA